MLHVKACTGRREAKRGMIQEGRKQRVKNIHRGEEVVERECAKVCVGGESRDGAANQINATQTSGCNESNLTDTKSLFVCVLCGFILASSGHAGIISALYLSFRMTFPFIT